ncbi:MAG: HYR domain-containing protein [Saprospiraceae bacterium]|nr:HYR domain-containing protein [Saprospiraceae bacterium]
MTDHRLGILFNNITVENIIVQHIYRKAIQINSGLALTSSGHLIKDNTIDDVTVGPGINIFDGNVTVIGNTVSNIPNKTGIELVQYYGPGSLNHIVQKNIITNVYTGIQTVWSSGTSLIGGPNLLDKNTITLTGGGNDIGIILRNANGGATVQNNVISGSAADAGIWMYDNGSLGNPVLVKDNIMTASSSSGTYWGDASGIFITGDGNDFFTAGNTQQPTYATITGNQISNFETGVSLIAYAPTGPIATVDATISSNTISGGNTGIYVYDFNGATDGYAATATIQNNASTITGAVIGVDIDGGSASILANKIDANGTGVRVKNSGTLTTTTNNFITNNTVDGISIEASAGAIGPINTNDLSGNAVKAINNASVPTVAATCNWYGSNVPATVATKISGAVTYAPYLIDGIDAGGNPADGFQHPVCGTPVVITSATPTNILCGPTTGSIEVAFTGGDPTFDIAWSGTSSGSASGISSGHIITPLAAGTYTVTVTSLNGTTSTATATIQYLPVTNTSDDPATYYATIQAAINAATTTNGEVITVCAGTYAESVLVNKSLTINGAQMGVDPRATGTTPRTGGESVIIPPAINTAYETGALFTISADNVNVNGFTFNGNNPALNGGIGEKVVNSVGIHAAQAFSNKMNPGEIAVNHLTITNNIMQNLYRQGVNLFTTAFTPQQNNLIDKNVFDNIHRLSVDGTGSGVYLENEATADVKNNKMTRVGRGLMTATLGSLVNVPFEISGNNITSYIVGLWLNNHHSSAPVCSVISNTISTETTSTANDGIRITSMFVPNTLIVSDNIITPKRYGYRLWNLPANTVKIFGGSITGALQGVYASNYYSGFGNATSTSFSIDNINIQNSVNNGISIDDDALNTNSATIAAEIKNSTISGSSTSTGILIIGNDASANIHDNLTTITGNLIGIHVKDGADLTSCTNNTITNNTQAGILIESSAGTIGAIKSNIISGNGNMTLPNHGIGLQNDLPTTTVDASLNYWGHLTGPYNNNKNLCGQGNAVIGNVTFSPWWTTPTGVEDTDTPPDITTCPASLTLNGCSTAAITGLVYSTSQVEVTLAQFTTAGGVATDDCAVTYYGYQDVATGTCPIIVTRTWTVKDGADQTDVCDQTITIERSDFTMPANPAVVTVACYSDIAALLPVPPAVTDNCGTTLTPTGPVESTPLPSCEGNVTYTWTYTDCELNTHTWVATYTIERSDFTMPANPAVVTVACYADIAALLPAPPAVTDNCGTALTPTGPVESTPLPSCEGNVTYTWTYTDCELNTHTWVATYTIERSDFTMPANPAVVTVACYADIAALLPAPPAVTDNCGTVLTPTGPVESTPLPSCEGNVTYTWTYTDCELNTHTWVATYTIERSDFTMPANPAVVTVACYADIAALLPAPPAVTDNCGTALTPTGPVESTPLPSCEGNVTYTWTYTDCELNTHTWVATYTIERSDFTMPANPAVVTVACYADIAALLPAPPAVTDNCGTVLTPTGPVESTPLPSCEGNVTYTWTYTDCELNTHTWVATYTIERSDFTMPANPVAVTVACAANMVSPTPPVVKDNCGNTLTPTGPVISTVPACEGNVTYTYTYTDCEGNTHAWVYTYTIDDTQAPTVSSTTYGLPPGENPDVDGYLCGATYSFNTGSSNCFATKTITRPVWSDNCGGNVFRSQTATNGVVLSVSPGTPGFVTGNFPAGTTVITFKGTDCAGNIGTCLLTIVVTDNVPPTLVGCPANPVVNAEPGVCSALVALVSPVASDNCAITSITHNATGATTFSGTGFLGSHNFNGGITNVIYTVSDGTNSTTCSFTVTVIDNQNPLLTGCPGDQTVNADPGLCSASVTLATPSYSDNFGETSTTHVATGATPLSGNGFLGTQSFNVGTTVVTYTIKDALLNSATCSFTITVDDTQAPVVTCVIDQVKSTNATICTYTATGAEFDPVTKTDNCGITTQSYTLNGGAAVIGTTLNGVVFQKGVTTVMWTVGDAAGNSSSCTFTVTVDDNEAPVVTCVIDQVKSTNATICTYTATGAEFDPVTKTDNCGITTQSYTLNGGAAVIGTTLNGVVFQKGVTTVMWTVGDAAGNSSSCTFTVTVDDNEAPVVTCVIDQVRSTNATICTYTATGAEFDPVTKTDNCGITTQSYTLNGGAAVIGTTLNGVVFQKGVTTVMWTVGDAAGNSSSCTFTVTVDDNEAPVLTCVTDQVRSTNATICTYTATGAEFDPVAKTDNCGITTQNYTLNGGAAVNGTTLNGVVFQKGVSTVTWTVGDAAGNTSSCIFTVTINDTEVPVLICGVDQIRSTNASKCTYTESGTGFDPLFKTDNCGITTQSYKLNGGASVSATTLTGIVFEKGVTTITWTVGDAAGNISSCTFTVTVNDTEAPVITCPGPLTATTTGCDAPVTIIPATASDNCTTVTVAGVRSDGLLLTDNYPVGVTTITWTATDAANNSANCTQPVTITSTSGALYVNDNSTLGDVYTTAVGDDINGNGTSCAPYATITKAISQAVPGNTIYVDAGTIADDVVINKQLTILGTNKDNDACSGTRIAESVIVPKTNAVSSGEIFHVAASDVTIKGFTIDGDNPAFPANGYGFGGADMHAREGVTVYETGINNLTVSNNIIKNLSYFGVTLYDYPAGVPSSGHVISNNKIMDMGTYDPASGIDFWGGGVLLYNNQYAQIIGNCMTNVRLGVQTGNYSQANPGAVIHQQITNNTIEARRTGIFHNLHYSAASPMTLSGNTITALANANETKWDGITLSSLSVPSYSTNNTINGNGIVRTNKTKGYEIWNVKSNAPADVSLGTVSGVDYGVFANNFEGYSSDASDGAHGTVTGVSITPNANGIGVRILDSPSSTLHAPVNLTLTNNTISGGLEGIKIEKTATGIVGGTVTGNIISASAVGIDVTSCATSATNGLTIQNNNVTLTGQIAGTTPTTGIVLANISGTQAATVSGNNITGPYYGYFVYNLNTTPVTSINGGNITGIMQGLAAINVDPVTGTTFAPSSFNADGITMSGFTGDYPAQTGINFHAGVYVFTGGSSATDKITANINNVSVTGTGKIAQDCAGMSFADFSTGAGNRQNIIITACNITDNKNRGINVRGANALVDIGTSTFTGNGSDPFGIGGNDGFGIIGRVNAVLNIHNNFITNPVSTTLPVTAILTDGATITATENKFNNSGNANGMLAVSGGATFTTSCNWWSGAVSEAGIAAYISGPVTYPTWLMSPVDDDGVAAGFQPDLLLSCYGTPITLTCVADQTEDECQTQAAIDTKFAIWLASTTASGCAGTLTNNNTGAPLACGGSTSVIWMYTTDCGVLTCTSTFTVTSDLTAPTVSVPAGSDIECSTGLPAAATTIAQFLALGATASDNCTATNDLIVSSSTGALVGNNCTGTITRTYTITDLCGKFTSVNQVFTVTDNTVPVATGPSDKSVEGCTELTALPQPKQIVIADNQAPETYYIDRYPPNGFSVVNYLGGERLKHEINAADCETCRPGGYNYPFYNTQGRKYDTPNAQSLAIDLYIPSDWETTGRRMAGLWGSAIDVSNGISAYPIVEFTSDGGIPRFRGWNSDPGGWIDMGLPTGFAYNKWYTISIRLVGNTFIYQVGDLALTENALGSVSISNMILQGHNNLTGVTYDIYWYNFKTKGVNLPYSTAPLTITSSQYSAEGGSASDNCSDVSITYQDSKSGTCPTLVTRTFTITDACGNPATKTQTITITDIQAPALTGTAYADATVYNSCIASAETAVPAFSATNAIIGYTDNCGQPVTAELTGTVTTGDDCNWTVTYTYTVKDVCGNPLANQTYRHSGMDLTAPKLTGTPFSDATLYDGCKVNALAAVPAFSSASAIEGYSDNCGAGVTATWSNTTVSGTNCNWTVTYTYTVFDACLNPLADQSYSHSGKDQTAPTASNPAPLTLQCFSQIPAPDPAVVIDEADNCPSISGPTDYVAYWPLDGNFNDVSSNGHHASVIGSGLTFTGGKVGQGATNFISGSYFTLPNLNLSTASLSAWVYVTDHATQKIFRAYPSPCIGEHLDQWEACGTYLGAFQTGAWHHIAMVDGVGVYIDGELKSGVFPNMDPSVNSIINVGGPPYSEWLRGTVDEIKYYNRALSPAEVEQLAAPLIVTHFNDANNGGAGSATDPYRIIRKYKVTDGCGNSTVVAQTITVSDNTLPVITMVGTTPVYICQGETYSDAGATALDNCDGDISISIIPLSTVNTSIAGTYTVTYNVIDASGNAAIPVVRTVEVQSKPFISNTVTAPDGYSQVMVSGGTYTRTACSHEELTTSIPSLTSTLADACGTLRIQTQYISTLPNIPSATVDVTFTMAVAAGPQTISPENHTGVVQTIKFITTPYYDVNGNGQYDSGIDIAGDLTTFTLTVPLPVITYKIGSTVITSPYVFPGGITTVHVTSSNACGISTCSFTVTVNDNTVPQISCPANVIVNQHNEKDPFATGYATATDNCNGTITITYTDNRSALNLCNATGLISRTWKATDELGNFNTCLQTISVVDADDPVAVCPADITVVNDAGQCSALVNFIPDAADFGFFQGFENPLWVSGRYTDQPSVDWNEYSSQIARVSSGTDGIASRSGNAHGLVNSILLPSAPYDYSGIFSRLGGYNAIAGSFGNGFTSSVDVYFDIDDPKVANSTYGWDVSTAVNDQAGNHRRDFIFHAAGSPGKIVVAADNGTTFARRNDLSSLPNHYDVTTTGWYKLEWKFRNNGGVLAVDCNLYNDGGTLLFTETRSDPGDLIASVIGGNRYMWFTFVAADKLAIDNTSLTRKPLFNVSQASGTAFPVGTTPVTVTATDACNKTGNCSFNVTVNDTEIPVITLLGTSPVYVCQGSSYADAGATAADNCGDLTLQIVPSSTVNTSIPATYTVTYNVVDGSGNSALPVIRTVIVNAKPVVSTVTLQTNTTGVSPWTGVNGDLSTGYEMCIDPLMPFHYLDIDALTANVALKQNALNGFKLDQTSLPANWLAYWSAKGVVSGAGGWQGFMWNIINGTAPIFYINYTGTDYQLIDGLTYQMGGGLTPLRITGDYPEWNYKYTGTVESAEGCISSFFDVFMEMNSAPVVSAVTLQTNTTGVSPWTSVNGDLSTGYEMCIDPLMPFHYLDIDALTANVALKQNALNGFKLDQTSLPANWLAYWSAKGVVSGAGGWQGVMWNIINGTAPIFYINYTGTDYQLIDGLTYQMGGGLTPLRITGDYPEWNYKYTGTVESAEGCISSFFDVFMEMNSAPVVSAVTLQTNTTGVSPWTAVNGDLATGYEMCIDPLIPFHYLDIDALTANVALKQNALNGFKLDQTSLPANWLAYWSAKGVVSGAGGWQGFMWNIIKGTAPIFYINYTGTDYQLIDGLTYQMGGGLTPLRITGDYPEWNYKYTGTVESAEGCISSFFDVFMEMNSAPVVSAVTLQTNTTGVSPWTAVNGDITTGYEMCIDPLIPFHYLDIDALTANVALKQNVLNGFKLDQASLPANWLAYWSAKGVVSGAGGWQGFMWNIIKGTAPIFYINYTGTDYQLIDGLTYQMGGGLTPLRITGDYPEWNYKYTGNVESAEGCISSFFDVFMELNSAPVVSAVTLQTNTTGVSPWTAVNGDLSTGYEMCIDPLIPFHYLDINTLTANVALKQNVLNGFKLDQTSLPANWLTYWSAKGVVSGAGGWQGFMWNIIKGTAPIFYINYTGTDYQLIDGLTYQMGGGLTPLRITGDYPEWNYKYTGNVESAEGCISSFFDVFMEMNSAPVVSAVTLQTNTTGVSPWTAVNGDLSTGYEMCIDPLIPFHYLDIDALTANVALKQNVLNGFKLDQTSLPANWLAYWSAKGVVSGAGGWQGFMWNIIKGTAPIFYINYTGTDYQLIDGLTYQMGGGLTPLRITGDYPEWNYKYTGNVESAEGCVSSFFDVFMELNSVPVVTCPSNIVVNNDPGICGASVAFAATSSGIPLPVITYKIGTTVITSPYVFQGGITTVDVTAVNACGMSTCSFTVTVNDITVPVITCPADVIVNQHNEKDPFATGTASATDNCTGAIAITYTDDRSGLNLCNATGNILRTWKATDFAGNYMTCIQTITVQDVDDPVADCPSDITVPNDLGICGATVNYVTDATDFGHFQGFENPSWVSGSYPEAPSVDWNEYNSRIARVTSGTDGIVSGSGAAHGVINSTVIPTAPDDYTGIFSRIGGYDNAFGRGFISSVDVYFDLGDPKVANSTYGWDVSTAVNNQAGGHRRDFIFHAAGEPGKIIIAADNGTTFERRNDLSAVNHYDVTVSGWYRMEWVFRNDGGILAVDCNLYNSSGTLLWTETRSDATDLIASVIGGNRYMWFTFVAADKLAIDNTSLTRKPLFTASHASGSVFSKGTTPVTITATDACGRVGNCGFNVTVNDTELPVITCKNDQTRQANTSGCVYTVIGDEFDPVSYNDNCAGSTVINSYNNTNTLAGAVFNTGTTPVTWTVTDASGNIKTCSFNIIIAESQLQVFDVTGGGTACANEQGVLVGLSDSEAGVNYQLYFNGNATGNIVAGTGDPLSFGYQNVAGTYNVKAVHSVTGCPEVPMNSGVIVIINPVPDATISGTATVVQNSSSTATVTFTGSGGSTPYTFMYHVNGGPVQSVTTLAGNSSTTVAQSNAQVGTFVYSLLSVTDDNGCIKAFSMPYPTAIITIIPASGNPDIRVRWHVPFNGTFIPGQTKDAVVRLNETGGHATNGTIQIFIPKIAGYILDFDETQTVATNPNVVVGNSTDGWTSFTYPNGALLLTTNNSIPALSEFKVAIKLTANSSMNSSILKVILLPGSGGDVNVGNNSSNINITTL